MIWVNDLLIECQSLVNKKKKVVALAPNGKKYFVRGTYVEDGILYLFPNSLSFGKKYHYNGKDMADYLVCEAQNECWYDWRTGSQFLACPVSFCTSLLSDECEFDYDNAMYVSRLKIDDKKIWLILCANKED